MFRLFICVSQLVKVLNYAKLNKDVEIVGIGMGMVNGNSIYVRHIELCRNVSKNPRYEFLAEPACFRDIYRIIIDTGMDVVSIIHSHTIDDLRPSPKDLSTMKLWNIPWIILNIDGKYEAWLLDTNNTLIKIEIGIVNSC